jgi:hypothetical protein
VLQRRFSRAPPSIKTWLWARVALEAADSLELPQIPL